MNCTVWYCERCERNNHILDEFCPTCGIKSGERDKPINEEILSKRKQLLDRMKELEKENWKLELQIKENKKNVNSLEYELGKVLTHG